MDISSSLDAGLVALDLDLSPRQREQLLNYVGLLQKWNRTYNLTAIRDPAEMLSHHLLDSLAVLPHLQKSALAGRREGWRLADVGSGAGLPGLVLAIARPEWRIRSIDTVDKKAAFQRQACIELGLINVEVVSGRVEQLPALSADGVISRAFADLADFVRLAGHLIAPGGSMLAMKGILPNEEIARLPEGWRVASAAPVSVPGLAAQRHLIVLEKV